MKNKIIIVEGKNDYSKIKQIYPEMQILITNGSAVSDGFLEEVKMLSVNNEIILFLDPDFPGEKIRKTIMSVVPNATHIFVNKKDAISKNKKKVGVEHVSIDKLKMALEQHYHTNYQSNITSNDLIDLGLMGDINSKRLRTFLCEKLNIGYVNSKQLVSRLNLFNINKEKIIKTLEEYL